MVACSFKRQITAPTLAGTKARTIRADRKRHAGAGETVQLFTGLRTRRCRQLGEARCTEVVPVRLFIPRRDSAELIRIGNHLMASPYSTSSRAWTAPPTSKRRRASGALSIRWKRATRPYLRACSLAGSHSPRPTRSTLRGRHGPGRQAAPRHRRLGRLLCVTLVSAGMDIDDSPGAAATVGLGAI
jgi:hypothetical protein